MLSKSYERELNQILVSLVGPGGDALIPPHYLESLIGESKPLVLLKAAD
jgi:hypothetical protein